MPPNSPPDQVALERALRTIQRRRTPASGLPIVAMVLMSGAIYFSAIFAFSRFDFRVVDSYRACRTQPDTECLPDAYGEIHSSWMTRYHVRNAGDVLASDSDRTQSFQLTDVDMSPGNDVRKPAFGFTYFVNGQMRTWAYVSEVVLVGAFGFGILLIWYRNRRLASAHINEMSPGDRHPQEQIASDASRTNVGRKHGISVTLAQAVRDTVNGARSYWRRRVARYPRRSIPLFLAFLVTELALAIWTPRELALTWVILWLSFVIGDIMSLRQVARCPSCGFLMNPAPAHVTRCPACGGKVYP